MENRIYARKSDERVERQIQSIEDQVLAMQRTAERDGRSIDVVLTETKSARAPGIRPVFAQLVRDIERGKVEGLYVWNVNRISRNTEDSGKVAYLLQSGKLKFIRTADRYYGPDDAVLLFMVETSVAAQEIVNLQKNVSRGMEGKIARGGTPFKAVIGYKNDRLNKTIDPDPELFPVIRQAFELVLAGTHTRAELYRTMRTWQVKSARWRQRSICRSYVHQILTNPYYCGQIRFRGSIYPATHKPMVTPEEFARVQRIITRRFDPRPIKQVFPYTGFIRHDCGCLVTAETHIKHYRTTNRTATYTYYHCTGSTGCPKRSVSEDHISERIVENIRSIQFSQNQAEWCLWAFDELERRYDGDRVEVMKAVSLKATVVKDRLQRLLDLRLRNEITEEEYADAKKKLKKEAMAAEESKDREANRRKSARSVLEEHLQLTQITPEEYLALEPPEKRGYALRLSNRYLLTLENGRPNLKLELDPIFQLFAAFEPSKGGSGKLKVGVHPGADDTWWTLVDNVRTELLKLVDQGAGST